MSNGAPRRPTGDLRPEMAPPKLPDPVGDQLPKPWDWSDQNETEAAINAEAVADFVSFYNRRYAWTKDHTIPPCWAQHGALIEEITTLMWSRWEAFLGPRSNPGDAHHWHNYNLPLFIERIPAWIGHEAAADCRTGHHQPSRLVALANPEHLQRPQRRAPAEGARS